MKKLVLATLMVSGFAHAQSQLPSVIKEYVVQPTNKFEITLFNGYDKPMTYDIFEDGKPSLIPAVTLTARESRKLNVWVNTPRDEYSRKTICSQPRLNGNLKVQMCSRIITYFPASSLGQ